MDLCFLKNMQGRATTRSLVASITQAVDAGLLSAGEKLPSSREIAQFTGTSRTTVVRAFDELIARGYLTGRKGQATYISNTPCEPALLSFEPPMDLKPATFSGTLPIDLLPIKEWQKCLVHQCSKLTANQFTSDTVQELRALKQAICGFLRRTEGILCTPSNVVVFTGTAHAMQSLARLTVNEGMACENKGSAAFELFQKHGALVSELSIDSAGARIDAMGTAAMGLKWLYVTPTGSRPSGITLSDARRYELIEWARMHSGTIIENATGTEFQYAAKSSPSLFAQDRSNSVIYHRSLTGLLHPLVNLEFMVIPDRLLEKFHASCPELITPPLIEHLALTDFINDGFLEKHIRSAWKVLRRRRQMLIFALKQRFDCKAEIYSSHAGTQIVVRFDNQWTKESIVKAAKIAGLPLSENDLFCPDSPNCISEFIIDFSAMDEASTEQKIQVLASELTQSNIVGVSPQMIFTT